MTIETGTDSGFLSIDQAVAQLDAADEKRDETPGTETPETPPAEAQEPTESEAAPDAANDADEPEGANDGEVVADIEAQDAPIEPPQFWSAEDKAHFRSSSRDAQEAILRYEQSRNAFTSKAAQEASEKGKAAEAERARLVQFNEQLSQLVPQAKQAFTDKWANVDWVQLTDHLGAEQATKLKFQYDAEQAQLARLQQAQAETSKAAYEDFVKSEFAKLPSLCPALTDAKEGPKRQQELAKYIVDNGIPPDALRNASAAELTVAWKAQQWDLAQAKANLATKQQAKPASAAPAPRPTVRATAAPAQGSPKNARLDQLSRKRSWSIDEAVEAMTLQGSSQ